MKRVVLVIGLLILTSGTMWSYVPDEDFNWEKYFKRLENITTYPMSPTYFINKMGNEYFGTKNKIYSDKRKNAIEILRIAVKDKNQRVKRNSIEIIVRKDVKEVLPDLIDRIKSENDKLIKKYLIWAVGKIGTEKQVLPLTQFLKHEKDTELRAMLSLALGRIGGTGDEIRPLLYMAEHATDLLVKCAAILGIGRLKIDEGQDILLKTLNHAFHEVRYTSILSLTFLKLKDENKVKEIIEKKFSEEGSLYVRLVCAFFILKRFGYDSKYANFLVYYLDDRYHKMAILDFMENLRYPKFIHAIELRYKKAKSSNAKLMYGIVLKRMKNPSSYKYQ